MRELVIPVCKVDRHGRVICPKCGVRFRVPPDRTLCRGTAYCMACNAPFIVDDAAVEAFNHFLSKQGSDHSRQLLKDHEETPKELKEDMRRIILP